MLKTLIILTPVMLALMSAEPASAHFSQIFSSFKSQTLGARALATFDMQACEGGYIAKFDADWMRDEQR